jgi:hypothetical protein
MPADGQLKQGSNGQWMMYDADTRGWVPYTGPAPGGGGGGGGSSVTTIPNPFGEDETGGEAPQWVEVYPGVIALQDSQGNVYDVRNAPDQDSGGGGGSYGSSQAAFNQQQAMAQAQLEEDIRAREQRLEEIRRQEEAATGRQREELAAQRERLELQLQFNREELEEKKRATNIGYTTDVRGQDINRELGLRNLGADFYKSAFEMAGRDPVRSSAYLLGMEGGLTPLELGLQKYKNLIPSNVSPVGPAATLPITAGAAVGIGPVTNENILVGEGGRPEMVKVRKGRFRGVTPLPSSRMISGTPPISDVNPVMLPGMTLPGKAGAPKPVTTQPTPTAGRPGLPTDIAGIPPSLIDSLNPSTGNLSGLPGIAEPSTYDQLLYDLLGETYDPRRQARPSGATTALKLLRAAAQARTRGDEALAKQLEARAEEAGRRAAQIGEVQAADMQSDVIYKALYGDNPPPVSNLLTDRPNVFGVTMTDPREEASDFMNLPPDLQLQLLSAWGLINFSPQEIQRRMQEVTPVGLRSSRFGYG